GSVARLRSALENLDEAHLAAQRETLMRLAQGSVGAELQFATACTTAYEGVRKQLTAELEVAEAKRLAQMKVYRETRQKRETLDGLRERQEAAYTIETMRREQQSADEVFLLRRFRESGDQVLPSSAAESAQSNTPQ